jgi:hypothetical protein
MKKKGLFVGMLALALTLGMVLAGCENSSGGGGGGLSAVESAAFTSSAGNNKLIVTLSGGTFVASPQLGHFSITTAGAGGFTALTGGIVTRDSNTQVTITDLTAAAAGSGQKITVAGGAQATQAVSVTVAASTLDPVESTAFTSAEDDDRITITLTSGTFVASPQLGHFSITTAGSGGFANLNNGIVTRNSDTVVVISGLTLVTDAGSGQKITVAAAAQATQAASVAILAKGAPTAVESSEFTSVVEDNTLTITLSGGTFVASPLLSHFSITTAGTDGFTTLTGGAVTRVSSTVVTITGLTAVAANGSGQKITVASAAQATQASSVTVAASTVLIAPTITTAAQLATGNLEITFTDNALWRAAVSSVTIGSTTPVSTVDKASAGKLTVLRANLPALLDDTFTITVAAAGYTGVTKSGVAVDTTPPALVSAVIEASAKSSLKLTFSEALTGNDGTGVTIGGSPNDITITGSPTGIGTANWTVSLSRDAGDETITISYTGSGTLRDAKSNPLAAIGSRPVTNNASVRSQFNAAASAAAVKALLTQANFAGLGDDGSGWRSYAALTEVEKTAVATAVYNNGTNYETAEALGNAIQAAIETVYTAKAALVLTAFNAAADAGAVKTLLSQANFTALGDDGTAWSDYAALTDSEKTGVATAVFNTGENYANVDALGNAIQGAIEQAYTTKAAPVLEAFNAAASADAVKPLLTQANFNALRIRELWSAYNGFADGGKTIVATAVWNEAGDYSYADELSNAIMEMIIYVLVENNLATFKAKLNAAIATGATVADINGFTSYLASISGYPLEKLPSVNSGNLSAAKGKIATAVEQDGALKTYKQLGPSATAEQTAEALGALMDALSSLY